MNRRANTYGHPLMNLSFLCLSSADSFNNNCITVVYWLLFLRAIRINQFEGFDHLVLSAQPIFISLSLSDK